jgi:phage terminase large subunit-like protein
MSVADAIEYAQAVVADTIPACQLVKLACSRFLSDIAASDDGTSPWEFRRDLAERVLRFAGLCVNVKGPLADKPLKLMPWQALVVTSLYGFVERGTTTRRFRQAVIFIPRGNGKTTFAAPLMLYSAFAEGEGGAEAYAAAVSRDQARLLWDTAKQMVLKSGTMAKSLGITAAAHSIYQTRTGSKCVPVSSDAKSLEGLSVAFCCCDEIASHISSQVYDVMLTAMGKRRHPLLISISTATGNNYGIGKTLWDYAVRVLKGDVDDDRLFALIYTIDEGDDPWIESTWIKANPSWGVSVQPDAIHAIMRQARNNPAHESAAMTRHLNVWQGADEALFSTRAWRECKEPTLDLRAFDGCEAELAVDLASRVDLASVAIVFPSREDGRDIYTVFSQNYINEAAVTESRNASYPAWAKAGHLIITQGNETDFSKIEDDILNLCKRFRVRSVGFDAWNGVMLAQRLAAEGVNMVEMRQNVSTMSEPTKELQGAIQARRIRHNGDPVLEWCIGNVVGHYDINANVKPNRSPYQPEAKIDAAIALVMAIGRCIVNQQADSVYSHRGLLVLGAEGSYTSL